MFGSIRWRIVIPFMVVVVLAVAALTVYVTQFVRQVHLDDLQGQLTTEARLLSQALEAQFADGASVEPLDDMAREWAALLNARVTIIGNDGTVLGESHEDRLQMDNHLYRPEVQQALASGEGSSIRFSRTLGYDMLYTAVPIVVGGQVKGFARVSLLLSEIEGHVARLHRTIWLGALVAALAAGLLASFSSARVVRPVRELTHVAERMAEGDFGARLFPRTDDEVGELSRAFNAMAAQLEQKMALLAEEQGRMASVLTHMADGVLITDGAGLVRLMNPAAARLLDVSEVAVKGRSFGHAVRHHRLIALWKRSFETGKEQEETIEMHQQGSFLRAIVTPLREGDAQGSVVILQDLTRIQRLEQVRRDFVSNVSHELRTPLASLKALVETLRDGALEDPQAAGRFLDSVEGEVDALAQMVQELLELSRIESRQVPMHFEVASVEKAVLPPVERLRPQAVRAGLTLTVAPLAGLPPVSVDVERIHQVVTNLVHNAVKFTPSGGSVEVGAQATGDEVVVYVKDTGVGIPAEDVARIFERFYKADRARSGGGTGLGLAIAKHIVQAHGGRIWVESVEGRGSTFRFTIPLRRTET